MNSSAVPNKSELDLEISIVSSMVLPEILCGGQWRESAAAKLSLPSKPGLS
jgi:hypothetical protein